MPSPRLTLGSGSVSYFWGCDEKPSSRRIGYVIHGNGLKLKQHFPINHILKSFRFKDLIFRPHPVKQHAQTGTGATACQHDADGGQGLFPIHNLPDHFPCGPRDIKHDVPHFHTPPRVTTNLRLFHSTPYSEAILPSPMRDLPQPVGFGTSPYTKARWKMGNVLMR